MLKHRSIYRYPLRLDSADQRNVASVAKESGRTINQVLVTSVRKGLPLAREALCQAKGKISNVKPLPDSVWRHIYSHKDEFDRIPRRALAKSQSQREPE